MPGPGSSRSLWLKWSWRDLRHRWISVLVIAIIIAVGTGVYAGLGSTSTWRRLSNDASFAQLHLHDLRIEVSPGSDAAEGDLIELVRGIPHADSVTAVQERLRLPTQVDASSADEVVLVSGELVGADLADTDAVDALFVDVGTVTPDGLLLEHKFARHFDLPAQGRITLAGGTVVAYSGQGVGPEEFLVSGADAGGFLAEGNYAVVYGALATIQQLTGRDGRVNDAVMTIAPGSDLDAIRTELEAAIASTTGLSATVTDRSDVDAHRLLYDDIDADQEIWNVLSILVLGAAAVGRAVARSAGRQAFRRLGLSR